MSTSSSSASSSSNTASTKDVTKILDEIMSFETNDDLWNALKDINYQGLDPFVTFRALLIATKTYNVKEGKINKTDYEAALKNAEFDLSLSGGELQAHLSDIFTLVTFAAKLGNNTKKVEKIPAGKKKFMSDLFTKYYVQNAGNKVPESSVITLTRILAVYPVIISVLLWKSVMKPLVKVDGLPLAFHHPQAWALMSPSERTTYAPKYKSYVTLFSKVINRKVEGYSAKSDEAILTEQWPFVELQSNDFSDSFHNKWEEIYVKMTGSTSYVKPMSHA